MNLEMPGKHEALVSPEVWYQVQSVLDAHQSAADAHSVHDHYLKGTVYCGQCGSPMMVTHARNRQHLPLFRLRGDGTPSERTALAGLCSSRRSNGIEDYYGLVGITPSQRETLAGMLSHEFDRLLAGELDELNVLTKQRGKLEDEQLKLMQAHYADSVQLTVLKKEQARISAELTT